MFYCEKCGEDKPDDNCQKLNGEVVCWDCFEKYISHCEDLVDSSKDP